MSILSGTVIEVVGRGVSRLSRRCIIVVPGAVRVTAGSRRVAQSSSSSGRGAFDRLMACALGRGVVLHCLQRRLGGDHARVQHLSGASRRRLVAVVLWVGGRYRANGDWGRGRGLTGDGIRGKRPPLYGRGSGAKGVHIGGCLLLDLGSRLVGLGSAVVVGDFETNLTGVLAFARQALPDVSLATAGDNDTLEVDPGFADEVSSLVVGEDGDFELVVVGGVVNSESEFLVPLKLLANAVYRVRGGRQAAGAYHLGVWPPRMSVVVFLASLPSRAAQ